MSELSLKTGSACYVMFEDVQNNDSFTVYFMVFEKPYLIFTEMIIQMCPHMSNVPS